MNENLGSEAAGRERAISRPAYVANAALLLLLAWPAQPAVDSTMEQRIGEILPARLEVFRLDVAANRDVFSRVDTWLETNIGTAATAANSRGPWTCWLHTSNRAWLVADEPDRGVVARAPFDVFVLREAWKRAVAKSLYVPGTQDLPAGEAIALARRFVEGHAFCRLTERDRWGSAIVLSRKRRSLSGGGKKGGEQILQRRVALKREFRGLEVVNSRQVVDLHPDTREVLGYASLRWSPVDEASAVPATGFSASDLSRQIEARLGKGSTAVVSGFRAAYFQTDTQLVPVLVVEVVKPAGKELRASERARLLFPLVRGVRIEEDTKIQPPAEGPPAH